jgi:dTDP-4-amino-4,6-dideoxyglucose
MSEVHAAFGLTSLDAFPEVVEANLLRQEAYFNGLEDLRGVTVLDFNRSYSQNHQYVVLEINEETCGLSRDDLASALWAENVRARRYFHPGCHSAEPYRSMPGTLRPMPVTERLCESVLVLPTGPHLSLEDVQVVCDIVRDAAESPNANHGKGGATGAEILRQSSG